MRVAVFCASANEVEPCYFREAGRLGKRIGELGWQLIYGGTNIGLMREVADATIRQGGEVTGIIPECIRDRGVAAGGLKQLIVAPDMKERKHLLREHADAFIALPGGWGTLEEITEVITLKQLGQHNKPIVFLNTAGYYKLFFEFIEHSRKAKFISSAYDHLYYIADAVEPALDYIQKYPPIPQVKKY